MAASKTQQRLKRLEMLPAARRPGAAKYAITPEQAGEIFDILAAAGAIEDVMRAQMGDAEFERLLGEQVPR